MDTISSRKKAIEELTGLADRYGGADKVPPGEAVAKLRQAYKVGAIDSLEPALPVLMRLKDKPYSLKDHYPFAPMFSLRLPSKTVWITGRQVAKTCSTAASGILQANTIPNTKSLFISPRFEQTRRFSNNYVKDFIDRSPVKDLWSDTTTENSVLQRSFRNGSRMIFSYASDNADRARGIDGDLLRIDEVQDIDMSTVPVLQECLTASQWEITQFTGTPKSLDNTIEKSWKNSSQAEWAIRCTHCTTDGRPTLNIPAMEYHLDAMIGPLRRDISEERPAIICHKCRQPISPRPPFGRWLHRYKDRRDSFPGYHVPQIIMPMHCTNYRKWKALLNKREHLPPALFYNECLGTSYDKGSKLVNKTDLIAACTLPWANSWRNPNDPPNEDAQRMLEEARRCSVLVLGVDWGGGGKEEVSYTTLALVGASPEGPLKVLWGKRLLTPHDPVAEAYEIAQWILHLKPQMVAHDYNGAGNFREQYLVQTGLPYEVLMPIVYGRSATRGPIQIVPATDLHPRVHYRVDKPMTLVNTCQSIRLKQIQFFKYDGDESSGDEDDDIRLSLVDHFLALVDEKSQSRTGSDLYVIHRQEGFSDDFAHAVNYACVGIWYTTDRWPDYARASGVQPISEILLRRATGRGGQADRDDQFFSV